MRNFTRDQVLKKALNDLNYLCMNMKNKQEIIQALEGLSERAGMMAAYISEREGYGCGDQGHEKAIKGMNKVGKIIHMKAFGYNAFLGVKF